MVDAVAAGPASIPQTPYFGGPCFMSPFLDRGLESRALDPQTEEMVRAYAERGHLIVDRLAADDSVLDAAVAELAELHEGGAHNRAWTVSDAVRAIAADERITTMLETLYGRRPIPFQTLNFRRGSQQETHSDSYHLHSYPKHFMCGVWVALEDIDERNWPVHYYPGSHRLPDYDFLCPNGDAEMLQFVQGVIGSFGLSRERARLKRGQALIWAANLLHGGDEVTDPESTRLSQVTHYHFEDCSCYTPFRSDFERGRIYFRRIVDVGSERSLPLRSPHGRVRPPMRSRLVTWRRRLQPAIGRGYVRYEL
ncbi:MAG: phytanoyl-CoA dioxygenase family protein [Actinobacteria bacterium]|nr:phytanoyl-CoA dioxygenase family protein [Actinomycetota bacterium]